MRSESEHKISPSDLSKTPEAFLAAIRSALGRGRFDEALRLADRALVLFPYPEDQGQTEEIQKTQEGRKRRATRGPVDECVCQIPTKEWIRENAERYRGRWVAVLNGILIADAESYKELNRLVDEKDPDFLPRSHFYDPWEGQDFDPQQVTREYFSSKIQQSLNYGSPRRAREWAEKGLLYYPDDPELKRLHWAFRP
ncbi:MAG TPA: DUF5678 domain-containing protein [Thermoanaerobaculia bacterium]|nr:DUF5678 domain-containing protein [Thermoanaerobaculia bacterium]